MTGMGIDVDGELASNTFDDRKNAGLQIGVEKRDYHCLSHFETDQRLCIASNAGVPGVAPFRV
jgi:hypothetical protein